LNHHQVDYYYYVDDKSFFTKNNISENEDFPSFNVHNNVDFNTCFKS